MEREYLKELKLIWNEVMKHNWKLEPLIQEIRELIYLFTTFECIHAK